MPVFYKNIKKNKSCQVVNSYRDYIEINDFLNLFNKILDKPKLNGIFNVSNDKPVSVLKILKNMIKIMKPKNEIEIVKKKISNDDIKKVYLDSSKIRRALSWKPEVSLELGLKNLIKWYDLNGIHKTYSHLKK